mgnify:CR=1 FL=1
MTYNNSMEKELIPQVIVETLPYQRAIEKIWDMETQIEFKNFIALNPQAGDRIPGTGGIRKIRWHGSGHGKRGGVRVIYYFYNERHPIYLLFAYPKNVQVNLTEAEKKAFSQLTGQLKTLFREKDGERDG